MTARAEVRLARSGGLATVTLDSPHNRNALSGALVARLLAVLDEVLGDRSVRVIELTGAGPVFCAGADLKEMSRHGAAGTGPAGRSRTALGGDGFTGVLKRLSAAGKPIVCALNGPARAGGVGLMAACDLVVAPLSATFAFSEVRVGVAPAVIAVPVMKRIPAVAARQLFLTGRTFDAAHAARIGLVDVAVADHEVGAAVSELVSDLLLGGPEALAATRRLVAEIPGLDEDEALSRMRAVSAERFASGEAAEGIAAWREKRLPSWAAS